MMVFNAFALSVNEAFGKQINDREGNKHQLHLRPLSNSQYTVEI